MSESDNELEQVLEGINGIEVNKIQNRNSLGATNWWENTTMSLTTEQLRAMVEVAIGTALRSQKQVFDQQIEDLQKKFDECVIHTPKVETYKDIEIIQGQKCDEPLDIVKSLPDFEGKQETYVSWRQAAHIAYKVFEKSEGSSKHYQAVAIIRNKIKGPADMVLSSFNTVLNFRAIINRLDFTYSDKRPIYLIEQELSILRQGNMTLLEFYDEVEKKLTLLTNKTIMSYDRTTAASINEKYRMDALRVFISGTKKALSDVLFSARPNDLPSALALAQEVESNHERYLFASNYARCLEDKERQKGEFKTQNKIISTGNQTLKHPHFFKWQGFGNRTPKKEELVQQADYDQSMRTIQSARRQPANIGPQAQYYNNQVPMRTGLQPQGYYGNNQTSGQAVKRKFEHSARFTGPKQQRINHFSHQDASAELECYEQQAVSAASEIDTEEFDQVNFLDRTPCYHS